MVPPFVSYVTFNRLGLTVRSLSSVLESTDEFELHIVDSHSADGTWEYITSLEDSRIKSRERCEPSHGKVYALNMNLCKRRSGQVFFHVESDVKILTADWIGRFLRAFEEFPEAGLLGVNPVGCVLPPTIPRTKNGLTVLELYGNASDVLHNFIPGCCMGLRPELMGEIGYFCEENCYGERELSYRVCNHTKYKAGFMTDVAVQILEPTDCALCAYAEKCVLDKSENTCLSFYTKRNKNKEFLEQFRWKFEETVRDMESGARPVYCASILDSSSVDHHIYNKDWALDNFMYFVRNAN
jgi:glycosyltransferase involved in cell wall biosynthesis